MALKPGASETDRSAPAEQTLDREIDLRLIGSHMNYLQTVTVKSQQTAFSALVQSGHYTVETSDFLSAGIVYAVNAPAQLAVSGGGKVELDVSVDASANLRVRGFPAYLCFGGCADLQPSNLADFAAARATSLFDYAGTDGAGDSNVYLADDVQTRTTITLARNVEAQLDSIQPVLPVMVTSWAPTLGVTKMPPVMAGLAAVAWKPRLRVWPLLRSTGNGVS